MSPISFGEIFIQDDHADVNSTIYSSAWSVNACMANRTASAIASVETLPRHSPTIAAQAMPLATCLSTCATSSARCCDALAGSCQHGIMAVPQTPVARRAETPMADHANRPFVKPCSMRKNKAGQSESLARVPTPGVSSSAPWAIASVGWPFIPHHGIRKSTRDIRRTVDRCSGA